MRRLRIPILSILLFAFFPVAQAHGQTGDQSSTVNVPQKGERFAPARRNGVPNRYIVILEDQWGGAARSSEARGPSVPEVASDVARLHAATPLRTWDLALPGFLVELPEEAARALSRDPRVRLVEQDTYLELQNVTEDCAAEVLVTDSGPFPSSPQVIVCDDPAPSGTGCFDNWGLDRIDEKLLDQTPEGLADRDGQYLFDLPLPGVTVHAYILDTGITVGHEEFVDGAGNTRIASGVNASVPSNDAKRNDVTDNVLHGHGTHTAGILGGKTYGVAKHVQIHPVKIAPGGSFSASDFVEGINWILANRPAGQPAVANLSANGSPSVAGAVAASRLVQSGVTFVQSAGNQNQLAANVSMVGPDFPQEIIIAGGMDERDGRWTRSPNDPSYSDYCDPTICAEDQKRCDCGSNFGSAVDIWAPASHIVSSGRLANNAICWLSGTSMAAPHVAGTAALLLGRFPNASPSAVEKAIKRNGTVGALTDPQISLSERLLYSRFPATGGPVAGDDRFFTPAGTPVDIPFAALLAGDFDWDRDPLSIVSFGTPSSGQRQILSDRIVYTPAAGFSGVATFLYNVTDGRGNNDTALVRIHVDDQFLPPLAVDDYFTVAANDQIYQQVTGLLANDSGRNGHAVNFKEIVRNPQNGILQIDFGGQRYYAPRRDFTGVDTYVYRIYEQETLLTADATVYLTVGVSLTSTPSPASVNHSTPITWTATASGLVPSTTRYALFRKKAGTTDWIPALTNPNWQASPNLSWTPAATDIGTWEIIIWVKDGNTPAQMNTYGYVTSTNPGPVRVVDHLQVTCPTGPLSATSGMPVEWIVNATGGTPPLQYALFRRRTGTTPWVPDQSSPAWQPNNKPSWTPASTDLGSWDILIWVRDASTPPVLKTCSLGPVQVRAPLTITSTRSPGSATPATPLSWTATATGGDPATIQYALFRRKVGAASWAPPLTSPAWQADRVLRWTPTTADAGTWEIVVWVRDAYTPPTMNTYGYAAYYNPGPVQIVTLTSNPSPAVYHGTAINWTATAIGFDPATVRYAMRRRRVGTADWIPATLAWQASNVLSWTPGSADIGTWEISLSARDIHTSSTGNGSGPAISFNPGQVQVAAPLTVTGTGSTPSAAPGTALSWTATPNGGTGAGRRYALFRKKVGATAWTPPVTSPAWQSSNVLGWTPTAAEAGTWEIIVWIKDSATSSTMNTYGYAAYYNPGPVQIVTLTSNPSPAVYHGTAINWTATATGFDPATVQYSISRRRVGTTTWIPATPAWQASNVLSWTPGSADIGTWEISLSARDIHTSSTGNGSGPAISFNPGQVQVAAPLIVTGTGSTPSAAPGTALSWTATPNGGTGAGRRYALFRKKVGATAWTPPVTSPAWQTGNVLGWTPTAAEAGTWEIIVWAKDSATPPTMNTYGYATYYNPGPVQVVTLTSNPSPAGVYHGTAINWTATAIGFDPATVRYAMRRRRVGTADWIPAAPAWQASNVLSWIPGSADIGTWEISLSARDVHTSSTGNGSGPAVSFNPGQVQVTAPLTVTGTGSPSSSPYGTTINWTAYANGGHPPTIKYALFRRLAGTSSWIPAVTSPAWQTSSTLSWTPTSSDVGLWEIIIWVKDGNTPPNMNTYGYAAYYNAGPVEVTAPVYQWHPPIGWVDGYDRQHIWGWACDPDYPTESNRVDIWSTSGQFLGSAGAYYSSASPINSACGGGWAHYFDFYHYGSIPPGTHFMVWSIDLPYATPGNDNRPLGGSGSIGNGTEFVMP